MRYPEAGGSASFARHAFDELVSFGAGWAQMLVYIVTIADVGVLRPALPLDLLGAAADEPVGHRRRRDRDRRARRAQHRRRPGGGEALDRSSRSIDFATQVLLVVIGFVLVFSPRGARRQRPLGRRARRGRTSRSRSRSRCSRTPGWRPSRISPRRRATLRARCPSAIQARRGRGVRDLLHAAARRPLGDARGADRRRVDDASRAPAGGGRLRERPDPRGRRQPRARRGLPRRAADLRRHARRDDPLHRDERRRDRRFADHVLDGELPADAGGLPTAPPAVQDAVALARRLRRHRADPGPPARRREVRRDAVLVRRDALVHRRARLARAAAHAPARRRAALPGAAEPADRRTSTGRCSRSSAASRRASRSS